MTGIGISLGPNDPLSAASDFVPVFHLHGVRSNPSEIIITREDYVSLFRPTEYRQIKLALTVRESTTLILGYGLGDVNVLTALDWSQNVYKSSYNLYPNDVIQIVYTNAPKAKPYREHTSIVIYETDNLEAFFEELKVVHEKQLAAYNERIKTYREYSERLGNANTETINEFIDNDDFRRTIIETIRKFPLYLSSGFIVFFGKCIDETWKRSAPSGAFGGYNQNLVMLLDILTIFKLDDIPPALFQTTAYALDKVAGYVGNALGQSYAAKATWDVRKKELSQDVFDELSRIARQHQYMRLLSLLE